MKGSGLLALLVACVANPPPQNTPGPPGTWTCKQVVESCDSQCSTGICLNACTNQGSPEGARLHAQLIQCAAANRCVDDNCTRAVCNGEVRACVADAGGMPPLPPPRDPNQPDPNQDPNARPDPNPRPDPTPRPNPDPRPDPNPHPRPDPNAHPNPHPDPHPDPNPRPDPHPTGKAPTTAEVTGDWSYGTKSVLGTPDKKSGAPRPGTGAGGELHLSSDGRFERATSVEATQGKCKTLTFGYAIGAWKLDGSTLVLNEKQTFASFRDSCDKAKNFDREDTPKTDRREVRMNDKHDLEVTDDTGDLQSYRKK